MCRFLSALVLRNGDIICRPDATDSHEDLIADSGLSRDDGYLNRFVRVEFTPDNPKDLDKPDQYKLHVDEVSSPDWFDESLQQKTRESLVGRIKRMIIDSKRATLLGSCWILKAGADVTVAKRARIIVMLDNSSVGEMRDTSSVGEMWGNSSVKSDKRVKK